WPVMEEQVYSYILFFFGLIGLIFYSFTAFALMVSLLSGRLFLYHQTTPLLEHDELPGVSVIKPLMGIDPLLEENIESHFKICYPQIEFLFCVQDDKDPAIGLVKRLQEKYPKVDSHIFIGNNNEIVNPLVQNMSPAYKAAKYGYIWISTSRIKANSDILYDMVGKILKPKVGLVHQMPFTTDHSGFAKAVEKVYFGCVVPRYFLALNYLGFNCFVGMSYLLRKEALDEVNGLPWYGRYLAEDFYLGRAIRERGYSLVISAYPAQQNVGVLTMNSYKDRMVRWLRLRFTMLPFVTTVIEPLTECLPLGLYGSWSINHFFGINPYYIFSFHIIGWLIIDYLLLKNMQRNTLRFSKFTFLLAWLCRELMTFVIVVEACLKPQQIKWGNRIYKVDFKGLTYLVQNNRRMLKL
ncbi:ceramide glucosyltransferase-like, partial [Argonauta hians]